MPELKTAVKIFTYFALFLMIYPAAAGEVVSGRDLRTVASPELEAELHDEVAVLSDSTMAGREFGSGGASGAAFYVMRQLEDAGYEVSVQQFTAYGATGRNVVAVTPGTYRSYIVVGAYCDCFGAAGGRLYPGADSNASGVAVLLSLARHFAAVPPEKSSVGLVFVAFDGHNADLAGSRAFVESCLKKYPASLMVNLDTVGSSSAPLSEDRPDYLIALGGAAFSESLSMANRTAGLQLSYDYYGNRGFTDLFYLRAGDQRPFLERGVPSVMFTSGVTLTTNKPGDTPDTLDYPVLARRVRMIASWISSFLK